MPARVDMTPGQEAAVLVITPAFAVASSVQRRLGALPGLHVDVLMRVDAAEVATTVRDYSAVILCPYASGAVRAAVRTVAAGPGTRARVLEMAEGPVAHALVLRTAERVTPREREALARLAAALDLPLEVGPVAWEPAGRPV